MSLPSFTTPTCLLSRRSYTVTHTPTKHPTKANAVLSYRQKIDPEAKDVVWHNNSRERCGTYQFNTKEKDQLFCPKCGASLGIDFRETQKPHRYGISVRSSGLSYFHPSSHFPFSFPSALSLRLLSFLAHRHTDTQTQTQTQTHGYNLLSHSVLFTHLVTVCTHISNACIQARTINNIDLNKLVYKKLDGTNLVEPAEDLSGQYWDEENQEMK